MNKLSIEKKVQIISLFVEGNSLRSTATVANVSFNTVLKLVPQLGKACEKFHDEKVVAVKSERIQADEMELRLFKRKEYNC